MNVSEKSEEYARQVERQLRDEQFRVTADYRPEKLGSKIRDAQLRLIPYMFVVGERDAQQGTVSIRDRIDGDLGAMPVAQAIAKLREEVRAKTIRQVYKGSAGLAGKAADGGEY